jgi:hypothetical protein
VVIHKSDSGESSGSKHVPCFHCLLRSDVVLVANAKPQRRAPLARPLEAYVRSFQCQKRTKLSATKTESDKEAKK